MLKKKRVKKTWSVQSRSMFRKRENVIKKEVNCEAEEVERSLHLNKFSFFEKKTRDGNYKTFQKHLPENKVTLLITRVFNCFESS